MNLFHVTGMEEVLPSPGMGPGYMLCGIEWMTGLESHGYLLYGGEKPVVGVLKEIKKGWRSKRTLVFTHFTQTQKWNGKRWTVLETHARP